MHPDDPKDMVTDEDMKKSLSDHDRVKKGVVKRLFDGNVAERFLHLEWAEGEHPGHDELVGASIRVNEIKAAIDALTPEPVDGDMVSRDKAKKAIKKISSFRSCGIEYISQGGAVGEMNALPSLPVPGRSEEERPTIVCLCGSTRFLDTYKKTSLEETMDGKIVLSIGCDMRTDKFFAGMSGDTEKKIKAQLDELHLRKIDLADEVLVLNVDGYIGKSTLSEIAYAEKQDKRVRYLFQPPACADKGSNEKGGTGETG